MKTKLLISALIFLFGSALILLFGILLNNLDVIYTSIVIFTITLATALISYVVSKYR